MNNSNLSITNFILIIFLGIIIIFGIYYIINQNSNQVTNDFVFVESLEKSDEHKGQLEYREGEVEIKRGDKGWVQLSKGNILNSGNEIRTLNESRAIVTFEDGSVLRLDENTSIKIQSTENKIEIVLSKGSIFNKVSKSETRKYSVQSGEYKIIALGTEFSVEKESESEVKVLVVESEVEIQNKDGSVLEKVETGKKVEINKKEINKKIITKEEKEEKFIAWNIEKNKKVDEELLKNKTILKENKLTSKTSAVDKKEKKQQDIFQNDFVEREKKEVEKKINVDILDPKIAIWGEKTTQGVKINWSVKDVDVSKGFKLVKSINKNPVYPGNDYKYFSNSSKGSYEWEINTGKGYYFRVCQYLGGKCGVYSKNLWLQTPQKNDYKEDNYKSDNVESISLSVESTSNENINLSWKVSGDSPKGFKISYSKNKNPTYPTRSGDIYKYLSNANQRSYKLQGNFETGETYYFRVCEYLGGKCGVYSNNASHTFSGSDNDQEDDFATDLSLTVSTDNDYVVLNWEVNGNTDKGFKAVYSKEKNPVYPGNSYNYISSESARATKWPISKFEDGKTYYFRVCNYKGSGVCGAYSNNVSISF